MIVEYKLNKTNTVSETPPWIEHGGLWKKPDNTFVGWIPDEANRDYYVPDTLQELSLADLIQRAKDLDVDGLRGDDLCTIDATQWYNDHKS